MRLAPLPRAPFLVLAGCALVGSPASPARAGEPAAGARIVHHRIEARFEPATSRIVARDVVDVDVSGGGAFTFSLWAGVDAVSMTFLDVAEGTGAVAPRRGDRAVNLTPFTASLPEGVHQVEIRYSGTMIEVPDDPHRGQISRAGIRLTDASGWYPTTANDGPARFDVDAWVPAPFVAVTQGGLPERSSVTTAKTWTGGERIAPLAADPGDDLGAVWNRIVARAVIPTDGCALFAGPYVTATREVQGIQVSTWFLPGEAANGALWLDAAADVVRASAAPPGAYPHSKLDVVEGFLPGTAGGPSYVVLGEGVIRSVTSVTEGAVVLRSVAGPASDPAGAPPASAAATGRAQVEARLAAAGLVKLDVPTEFPLGVADLRSKRDLILTTANGTEVLPNAFRPLFCSAERELGTPLPFGTAEGVPLPGRIPDTSPEGLARFFRQLATASPAALFVIPSPSARDGLAPFLDAPNDLTPTAEAELGKPGPDGKPRPRPDLRAWISARRARAVAGPGATPLPLPVLLLEDATWDRLDRTPTVTAVDFAVKFGPERATWAAGKGGTNVVYGRIPPSTADIRPPVVVLSASYDALDGGSGAACVLAALEGVAVDLRPGPAPKPGLIVCLLDGSEQGHLGSRALAPALLERYDVRAVVHVDRVGRVRDDAVSVLGRAQAPALAALADAAFEGTGLHVARPAHEAAGIEPGDHAIYATLSVPAIGLTATGASASEAPGAAPDSAGVARVVPGLRKLMMRLLSD